MDPTAQQKPTPKVYLTHLMSIEPQIPQFLYHLAARFWPELKERSPERKAIGVGEVISTLYAAPFALGGLIWLAFASDFNWLREHFATFVIFAVLIVIFNQLGFFLIIELRKNRYGSADGALTGVPLWAGVLIFGPTIFWLPVLWAGYQLILNWPHSITKSARWGQLRNFSMNLTSDTLVPLIAFNVYRALGGAFPFSELTGRSILMALGMLAVYFAGYAIFWAP
ncbi:MAG: hypothetical protein MUO62_11060, partial [Anaerolineales bacterium]|nr:hypothetical protein [Anaerolineales bacterium]